MAACETAPIQLVTLRSGQSGNIKGIQRISTGRKSGISERLPFADL